MPRPRLINNIDRKETLAGDITEADFNSYISAANSRISPFDLEIRSTFHQTSRQRIYALINSTSDPIMQLATVHTADEISFLKRLLDAMFETYNTIRQEVCAITSMQAMKLAKPPMEDRRETQDGSTTQGSSGQGLTLLQAEKTLQSLVDEGWFEKSRKGFYSLSPRALMELRGWLLETYNRVDSEDEDGAEDPINKVKVCVACKEILTSVSIKPILERLRSLILMQGQRCARKTCPCRLHDICTQNFFRVQKSSKCPMCRKEWTGDFYVGERAVDSTDTRRIEKRKSGAAQRRQSPVDVEGSHQKRRREEPPDREQEGEEEEEEENEEDEEGT